MVVGITGGIGSGKTTVVKMFAEFKNTAIYLADDEAKKLMNTSAIIKEKLIKEFSENVFLGGQLNKPYLSSIVFNDKNKLKTLNSIVHPVVHEHLHNFIKQHKHKDYIIYENAILFENESNLLCDKIITITAPLSDRINRVVLRDQTTKEQVTARIKNQWKDTKKTMQSHYVINNVNLTESKLRVLRIHNKLTKTCF